MPGILSVVACGRTLGVALPEFCLIGGLNAVSEGDTTEAYLGIRPWRTTYIRGEAGAVEEMLRE